MSTIRERMCSFREKGRKKAFVETYQEFLDRIDSFEKKEIQYGNSGFKGNPSISQKVSENNTFREFYGDTIVFSLNDTVKGRLAEYVDFLYQSAPECFCERLVPNTFHVTLHDLSNSPILQNVAEEMFNNELQIIERMSEIQEYKKINMKSKYIFNMVNTSLVLGLYPVDKDEYRKLMELYCICDDIIKLNYPFTPHITLAYYNVNGFDLQASRLLENAVNQLNDHELFEIELNVGSLYYQKFKSMNHYVNIINLGSTL